MDVSMNSLFINKKNRLNGLISPKYNTEPAILLPSPVCQSKNKDFRPCSTPHRWVYIGTHSSAISPISSSICPKGQMPLLAQTILHIKIIIKTNAEHSFRASCILFALKLCLFIYPFLPVSIYIEGLGSFIAYIAFAHS